LQKEYGLCERKVEEKIFVSRSIKKGEKKDSPYPKVKKK